jgi:hypothetical protein
MHDSSRFFQLRLHLSDILLVFAFLFFTQFCAILKVRSFNMGEESMSDKDKSLPQPPRKPFGQKRPFKENIEKEDLFAEKLAMAAAEGKADEFIKQEIPDNEYARKLVDLMMGMTGMITSPGVSSDHPDKEDQQGISDVDSHETQNVLQNPPEEILHAAGSGDLQSLIKLMHREHKRRMPDNESKLNGDEVDLRKVRMSAMEKDVIDRLTEIAKENSVSLEWLLIRAFKLYLQEYKETGRL